MITYLCNYCKKQLDDEYENSFFEVSRLFVGNWGQVHNESTKHFCDFKCAKKYFNEDLKCNQK